MKTPESLNLGVTIRDNSGCIITEWVQNFIVRKSGVLDGTQLYVLDGRFLCFLTEETVKLAAANGFDDEELEDEDFEEVLKDEN